MKRKKSRKILKGGSEIKKRGIGNMNKSKKGGKNEKEKIY